ncbi:MAG: ThuA domain-containing protein [Verrucomicrobiae bacterium]|nr:ThuA domain-containing protein [Verrucomicrobiae bacterium]
MKSPNLRSLLPLALAALAAVVFSLLVLSPADSTGAQGEAKTKKKIVLIAGKKSHPSGQHEFNAGVILLARALNEQSGLPLEVKVVHNGWPEDDSIFEGADAVVIYSDGNGAHPVNGHEAKMQAMADAGVGIMCMHYAVEGSQAPQGENFKKWIGGHYEGGYSVNPHWTATGEPNPDHPISRGVPKLKANDEWYYNMRWAQPKTAVDIFGDAPTREKINRYVHWTPAGEKLLGKKQTMMWAVERPDGGRGVGFTGGHWHRNWAIDDFRTLVLNAMVWVAGMEVPEDGVKSDPITEAQLNENLDPKDKIEHVDSPSAADLDQPAAEQVEYRWPGMEKQ